MNTEEPKCGDDCKLVEMLATKTSKQQAMENAIAAVQTEKMTPYGAAKAFKLSETSLRRRLKKVVTNQVVAVTTEAESEPTKPKTADKAERDQWWADHQAGLSARKISDKYGRSRLSITKEINRREEAASQSEPTPTPAPAPTPSAPEPTTEPAPAPSVPSAGSSAATPERWADHPLLDGWNGNLNELSQKIYNREVVSSRKRVVIAEQLAEYKLELEKTMNAASKSHRVKAGALLEADVRMVEAKLQEQGRPGIMETLESVRHEAERIYKFATRSLEILQLVRPNY